MSKYFVDGQDLTDIADAIRTGLASTASLEFPDDFVTGIGNISGTTPTGEKTINVSANGTTTTDVTQYATAKVVADVPNTYAAGDEGKVVSSGALVAQTSSSTTINGTFDTTLINSMTVNVSGGVTPTGTKQISITQNGTTTEDVTNYASAEISVNVSGGKQIYYSQYTLTGDAKVGEFINGLNYAVHSQNCIIMLRSNGTVAPTSGSYTINNMIAIFIGGTAKGVCDFYQNRTAPNSMTGFPRNNESPTHLSLVNGVLHSSSTGTSCFGGAGDTVTLVEIEVDADFWAYLYGTKSV